MTWNPSKVQDPVTDNNLQHMATQIRERQAAQQVGFTSTRPSNPQVGWMFFDQTLGKPIFYRSDGWVDATGTLV